MNSVLSLCKKMASARIVRTIVVGGIAVIVQTIIFEILGVFLQLAAPSTAVVIGAEAGILTNFYLNNRFSFNDRQHTISLFSRLVRFHMVVSGSVILQWLFVFITEHQTSDPFFIHIAYAAGIILGFAWNYTFYLLFVWRHAVPTDEKLPS